MRLVFITISLIGLFACNQMEKKVELNSQEIIVNTSNQVSLFVLGTAQDAGSPQIGCIKKCCSGLFANADRNRMVTSLGLVDFKNDKKYLFEATPDMVYQMKELKSFAGDSSKEIADGIFLTHAHIGHYTGLMYLGKEAINAKGLNVYAMPKMVEFLESNGPWSQLVKNENVLIQELKDQAEVKLTSKIKVVPFLVPHRDEFSETVGYKIFGTKKTALFIPDIDKWEKWEKNILDEIREVDYAFLDGTFYDGEEINNRDISEIPHPFIIESMKLFSDLSLEEKKKVFFIHFNHTNEVLNYQSEASKTILKKGFGIARRNDRFEL